MQDKTTNDELNIRQSVLDETAASLDTVIIPVQPVVSEYKKREGFKYGCYLFVKRVFDLLSAGILFLVLSPFLLIFLLVKWLEDFHNPVYVSWRVGKDGKPFRLFKIRTMKVGAEAEKAELEKKGLNEADGPVFKIKNDPRITRVGRFYRRFSIDELLQLLNIINGTMSVVGPVLRFRSRWINTRNGKCIVWTLKAACYVCGRYNITETNCLSTSG